MCLIGGKITVALVTTHIPLSEVPRVLKQSEIVRVGLLLADFVQSRRRTNLTALSSQVPQSTDVNSTALNSRVRIAVCGLNPHAGESGKLGREEIEIISPAIAELKSQIPNPKSQIIGPVSPDTVFHHAAEGEFDAVLCMYHDQGLIPLKLHAFHNGVNVTLGLPFPRTSPDHGTAFEIAGKGIARPDSMIAAIRLAVELAETQKTKKKS
jgi:4-hydroxy-L-threonine phosphate dehydrogenase PdxA